MSANLDGKACQGQTLAYYENSQITDKVSFVTLRRVAYYGHWQIKTVKSFATLGTGWRHSRNNAKSRGATFPTCRMELVETVPDVLVKKHLVSGNLPVQHASTIRVRHFIIVVPEPKMAAHF